MSFIWLLIKKRNKTIRALAQQTTSSGGLTELFTLQLLSILLFSFERDPHSRRKQQQDSNVVESSTVLKSDAGSDGTQPASCVDIQNRQSTYSCRCPMYGACQNNVFCGLFCSATLAIRCRSRAPFVHERLKAPNTSLQAVEPDP